MKVNITEYEQHGEDRAKYGDNLINRLAKEINRKGFEPRTLRLYRRIYLIYPQLGTEIGTYLHNNSPGVLDESGNSIWQSATAKLQSTDSLNIEKWQVAFAKLEEWSTSPEKLFYRLNFSNLSYNTTIDAPLKGLTPISGASQNLSLELQSLADSNKFLSKKVGVLIIFRIFVPKTNKLWISSIKSNS